MKSNFRHNFELRTAHLRTLYRRATGQSVRPCSWCLAEKGIRPMAGDSHGMCNGHFKVAMEEADRLNIFVS